MVLWYYSMFFVSHETRQRHAQVDRTLERFHDFLDTNDAAPDGHITPEKSQLYRDTLDHLAVPNIRAGMMQMSKRALRDENYIPIWSLKTNEKLLYKKELNMPMPLQQDRMRELAETADWSEYANGISSSLKQWRRAKSSDPILEMEVANEAVLSSDLYEIPSYDGAYRRMLGRPRLLLNQDEKLSSHRPDTIAHELEHVKQFIEQPLQHYETVGEHDDDLLQKELMAYQTQVPALDEVYRQGGKDEDLCAVNKTMLGRIAAATVDARYDTAGYIQLNETYRQVLVQRLARHNLTHIAPGLERSALDRTKRFGELVTSFPKPHAHAPTADTVQSRR